MFDNLLVSAANERGGLFLVLDGVATRIDDHPSTGLAIHGEALVRGVQPAQVVFSEFGLEDRVVPCPDIHDVQSLCGDLYLVATETNEVLRIGSGGDMVRVMRLDGERDSHHLNCVGVWRGELVCCAFGDFESSRGYKGATAGAGFVQAVKSGRRLISGLNQPHSPVGFGDNLIIANSGEFQLCEFGIDGTLIRSRELDGYVRGLLVRDQVLFVALSKSRNADDRGRQNAVVIALSLPDWSEIDRMPIPADEIYSICHVDRHSRPFSVAAKMCRSMVDRQREAVSGLETRRAELEAALASFEARVSAMETIRAKLESALASRDAEVPGLQTQRAELESALVSREAMVSGLETQRAELESALVSREAVVSGLETQRAELESALASREAMVSGLETQRAELESALASCEAMVSGLETQRAELESALASFEARVFALETMRAGELATFSARERDNLSEIGRLRADVRRLNGEIQQYVRSRCWRLTRPLRSVNSLLARARKKFVRDAFRRPKIDMASVTSIGQRDMPDILMWAVIDWDFRTQRPQHLARELAIAGHRVFYISNNMFDYREADFRIDRLDESLALYRVQLAAAGAPAIYGAGPEPAVERQIVDSLGKLILQAKIQTSISIVQHPFWLDVADVVPNSRLVYDCMDHHEGFGNNSKSILQLERQLIAASDLVVTTSQWLFDRLSSDSQRCAIIRNAAEFERFASRPERVYVARHARKVIGYYGAVAEWFDEELVAMVAGAFPDCEILIIGADTVGAEGRLGQLSNVTFVGEVPYVELPSYLHSFDVCMLPFRILPLTQATNPVKVYEYLAAGKPVVTVDLPELRSMERHVSIASSRDDYIRLVAEALANPDDPATAEARKDFARSQTWRARAGELVREIESIDDPVVSVVVLSYNNLEFTRACLYSLEIYSAYPNLEVIVVDNGSNPETVAFLESWSRGKHRRKLIANQTNAGFAAGNNQGVSAATGEYVVLLNNDTYVTRGWVRTMLRHLRRNPQLGMVGPVTNNIGNEAKIDVAYRDMDEMAAVAQSYVTRNLGRRLTLRTLACFCVMLERRLYVEVGGLDEGYGLGFFEDDDLCRRIEQRGLGVACVEDVFVHHHLSASFGKLSQGSRKELFERNKQRFEQKWGPWAPHRYRGYP